MKKTGKIRNGLIVFCCLIFMTTMTLHTEVEAAYIEDTGITWPEEISIMGEAGIVMESSTGTILYEKNKDKRYYPASITKIMTALLTIENCELNEIVTVPHEAVYMEGDKGSHIALDEGERLTVEQCLYAIMLASANDAAYSLAIHIGGSIEKFSEMMNIRAEELGCQNTNFENPAGLPDDLHQTTAYDMALIARKALSYDVFRKISGASFYEIPQSEYQKDTISMYNHHKMIGKGEYADTRVISGKNGYTATARNTLVTCAQANGMEIICVIMKSEGKETYTDTIRLLDFSFQSFDKIRTKSGCDVVIPLGAEESDLLESRIQNDEQKNVQTETLQYFFEGHQVGSMLVEKIVDNEKLPTEEMVTVENKEEIDRKDIFLWMKAVLCIVLGVAFLLGIAECIVLYKRKKRRNRRWRR